MGETRALLVMKDGEIIAERYGAGFDSESRLISWSIAKTIPAVLAGLRVSDGGLVLDAPAQVPAWRRPGARRGQRTHRQFLNKSSGLENSASGEPGYEIDTGRMHFLKGEKNRERNA